METCVPYRWGVDKAIYCSVAIGHTYSQEPPEKRQQSPWRWVSAHGWWAFPREIPGLLLCYSYSSRRWPWATSSKFKARSNFGVGLALSGELDQRPPEVPFSPSYSVLFPVDCVAFSPKTLGFTKISSFLDLPREAKLSWRPHFLLNRFHHLCCRGDVKAEVCSRDAVHSSGTRLKWWSGWDTEGEKRWCQDLGREM